MGGGRGKKPFFQYFPIFSIHSDPNTNGFKPFIDNILGFIVNKAVYGLKKDYDLYVFYKFSPPQV